MKPHDAVVSVPLMIALLAACGAPSPSAIPSQAPSTSPTPPPTPTSTRTQIPTLTPTPIPPLVPLSDVIEGASVLTYGDQTPRTRDYMFTHQLQPLGINWVGLVVYCYQESPRSLEVDCHRTDAATTSDAELAERANLAHELGLRVMLHPQLIALNGDFPIVNHGRNEDAWAEWFGSYTSFITHYAQLAQSIGADFLVIGNEMAGSTQREAEWRAIASAVRQHFSGRITYAAHTWDVFTVSWWDSVDAIGVNPYFELTNSNHPTSDELDTAMGRIVSRLAQLSKKWNRPVLITEIGYVNLDGANYAGGYINPFCGRLRPDLQEQADLHEAFLSSFEGNPWWLGVFWWVWGANPAEGAYSLGGPQGKPAEDVLRRHYGGQPRPSATPIPELLEDPDRQMILYQDALDRMWTLSTYTTVTTDLAYKADRYRGEAAIRISVDGSVLEIDPIATLDLSAYDFLEFFVKFPGGTNPLMSLSVGDWSPESYEVSTLALGVPLSTYSFPAYDGWFRIRVPLAELFRAEVIEPGRRLTELGIVFNEYCPVIPTPHLIVLIDEIRFVGGTLP